MKKQIMVWCSALLLLPLNLSSQIKKPAIKKTSLVKPPTTMVTAITKPAIAKTTPQKPPAPSTPAQVAPQPTTSAPTEKKEPAQAQLDQITASTKPIFSEDENNKLNEYEDLFSSLGEQTDQSVFTQAIDSFIQTIVPLAMQSNSVTLQNIIDTKETTESAVSTLAQLNARLRMQPKTDALRKQIATLLRTMKRKSSELGKRIETLKDLKKTFENTAKMNDDNLDKKLASYDTTLKKLSSPLPSDMTQKLISDLDDVGSIAKYRGGPALEKLKEITHFIQSHPFFNVQQKQQATQVTYEKPTVVATKLETGKTAPTATIEPAIKDKIQEIKNKQHIADKILGIRSLLSLITSTSNQAEKNELINFLNELFLMQSKMTRQELIMLKESFAEALQHKFFLAYNQRPVMNQWIKALTLAIELIDQESPLITALKKNIENDKDEYIKAIQSAFFALNLLDTQIDPTEKDKKNKNSLISVLRSKLTSFYSKRGNKTIEELDNLKNLFAAIKAHPEFSGMIVATWEESIDVSIALATANEQNNALGKISSYSDIAKMIKPEIDPYEKGIFVNGLTNIFENRKERAAKELEQFKDILSDLIKRKGQKLFDDANYKRFETWNTILDGTIILLGNIKSLPLTEQIKKLSEAMRDILSAKADYEKDIFIPYLSHIFSLRGELTHEKLNEVKIFFEKIKNAQGLMATNQMSVLLLWMQEINDALTITKQTKSDYAHALLEQASKNKNLDEIEKAVNLFTENTTDETKNLLVSTLNALFQTRSTLDLIQLKELFDLISKKELGKKPLLNDMQRDVIDQWSTILDGEISK